MLKDDVLMSKEDGLKLKIIRDNMGLSVAEFSEKTKINPSFINLLEKGCLPLSTRDKRKISETFELPENWFDAIDISGYVEEQELKGEVKVTDESDYNDKDTKNTAKQNLYIADGESLKATRTILGLSRKEIAAAIGVTSVQIGYIETGKRNLTDKIKKKLNDYLKTSLLTTPQNQCIKLGDINTICFKNQDQEMTIYNISGDDIVNKIKMLRKEKRYTQIEVSEKSGVNRSQLSMIENGKIPISKKVKIKLLDFISAEEGIKFQPQNPIMDRNAVDSNTEEDSNSVKNNNRVEDYNRVEDSNRAEDSNKVKDSNRAEDSNSAEKNYRAEDSNSAEKNYRAEDSNIANEYNSAEVAVPEQIKLKEISANIAANKFELIKMIASMKKTRDELISNIGMLEKVLSNM